MRLPAVWSVLSLVLPLAVAPAGALAQVEMVPTESPVPETPRSLMSGKGVAVAGFILAASLMADQGLRGQIQEYRGTTSNAVARVGNGFGEPRYVLPVLAAGFLAGKVTGNRSVARVALRAGGAVAIAGGLTTAIKYAIGRNRPRGDSDADQFRPLSGWNSFPSGHTAVAFAVATAIAEETRDPWSDAALYGAATLTALARLNDDRHWTSDVFVGALVGHLSARWLSRRQGGLSIQPTGVTMSFEF